MINSYITALLLITFLVISPDSSAELFKWVDKNGKIHYSDKKPKNKTESKVIPQKSTQNTASGTGSSARAVIRPYEKTARKLLLLNTQYGWRKESEFIKPKKIGAYYIGKGCTSRGAMKVPDVYINHKSFFPKESQLASRIKKVINSLDYDSDISTKYKLIKRLRSSGGLSLHSEIIDIEFNSCAPNTYKNERLKPVSEISEHKFKKHRIKLKIRWLLKTNRDQDNVYEAVTNGSYNGWNQSSSAQNALGKAVESATLELFADKKFIKHILVEEDTVNTASTKPSIAEPIQRDTSTSTHKLSLNINEIAWSRRIGKQQKIGNYLFGERCSAKKPMTWSEASSKHKRLFPSFPNTNKSIIDIFITNGYAINMGNQKYNLQAELLQLDYNSCAPSLHASNKYKDNETFSSAKLNRNHVKVTIKWILKKNKNRTTVYQARTEGFAGDMLVESTGSKVMLQAISNATEKLLSEKAFIAKITQDKPSAHVASDFPKVTSAKLAISRPSDKKSEKLFLISDKNIWNQLKPEKIIGIYAYGDECVPYKDIIWPDAINDYPKLYPDRNAVLTATSNVIKSLDYSHQITDQYNVLKLQRKLGGYSLSAKIIDIRFDSCTPNLSYDVVLKSKYKLANSQFKRHRAYVSIKWQLINATKQVVFETTTKGLNDSWLYPSKAKNIIKLAVENATSRLFANQRFINIIVPDSTQQQEQNEGFISRLINRVFTDSNAPPESPNKINNKYMLQAHLGQALTIISPLKIAMEVHYSQTGEWADNIGDIGFSHTSIDNHKEISDISLQGNGSILVELQDIFGTDKMIQFSPVDDSNNRFSNLRWDCSTNLDKEVLFMDCGAM